MHITLPEKMEKIVLEHVETGLYSSASEVCRDALRVWIAAKSSTHRRRRYEHGIITDRSGIEAPTKTPEES